MPDKKINKELKNEIILKLEIPKYAGLLDQFDWKRYIQK